jgi:hypothetical protein
MSDSVVDLLSAARLETAASSPSTTPGTPTSTGASKLNLSELQWVDVFEEEEEAAGVCGCSWDEFTAKQIRVICVKLLIKRVRNAKKEDMVERIRLMYKNRKKYGARITQQPNSKPAANETEKTTTRKQIQCPFRLMNILFSDDFVDDFADLGNVASWQLLDSGKAGNQHHFWQRIATAFAEENESNGVLRFLDDDVMTGQDHIDPSKIVPHPWKKLRDMWKAINAEYKAALVKYTQSGTHDHNFYAFCNGKVETYYLRKYLDLRPNVTGTVEADLPEECAISSDSDFGSSKKRKKAGNEVLDAIREYKSADTDSELTKQKLFCMQNEEKRRDKEEKRREKEEERRHQELLFRIQQEARVETEHNQKRQRNMLDEWKEMVAIIRNLRQDLRDTSLDEESKHAIALDIDGLSKRKDKLAVELGIKD